MYFICLSHNLLYFHSTYKLKIYISDIGRGKTENEEGKGGKREE